MPEKIIWAVVRERNVKDLFNIYKKKHLTGELWHRLYYCSTNTGTNYHLSCVLLKEAVVRAYRNEERCAYYADMWDR